MNKYLAASLLVLIALAVWLTPESATSAGSADFKSVPLYQFLAEVQQGTLKDGAITYAENGSDFASLKALATPSAAEKKSADSAVAAVKDSAAPAASVFWSAQGRLTPDDLKILRAAHFDEALATKNGTTTARPRRALLREIAVNTVYIGLFVGAILIALPLLQKNMGAQHTNFSGALSKTQANPTRFTHVAGCDEAKQEITEVVEYLKNPSKFAKTGGRMPKGILLVGPPGTGKTLLARAVAGEAGVPFFSVSGSDFMEMFVGVGAARVRTLFKTAGKKAPCIIFIDELDAIGQQRGGNRQGNDEREQTLNAILVAMDGFDGNKGIIVFAATNRAEILDKALLRPGRFDRQVHVNLPDLEGREQILRVHTGKIVLDETIDLREVAKATPGFSGADLANLANEAALHAARNNHSAVTHHDFDEAREKISWGREQRRVMTFEDRRTIAYHEAGHALLQVYSAEEGLKLHKVTIIPRGQSLGSTHFTPERDRLNYSEAQLVARLRCLMGGRVAEEIALGQITSGAAGDIEMASNIARSMVFEWGMSPLGFVALTQREGQMAGSNSRQTLATGDTMARAEEYVLQLLREQYEQTKAILTQRREQLDTVAKALLEQETLTGEEVVRLCAA
ncbi:MAG TPA: ATP-dependent zinc metalloprotease FtsH [Opitutaceae bacterium]|nr:ATP-dependent zinc metalloprotease FtsH [Opitutaceae bacterium]